MTSEETERGAGETSHNAPAPCVNCTRPTTWRLRPANPGGPPVPVCIGCYTFAQALAGGAFT